MGRFGQIWADMGIFSCHILGNRRGGGTFLAQKSPGDLTSAEAFGFDMNHYFVKSKNPKKHLDKTKLSS